MGLFSGHPKNRAEARREGRRTVPGGSIPDEVEHTESYRFSSRGVQLFTQLYRPKHGPSKGLVLQLHGYGDSSQWFQRLDALRYCKEGFTVASLDHQGHGCSDGLLVHIPCFDDLVHDAYEYAEAVVEEQKPSACFMVGESMGGAIAVRMLQLYDQSLWSGVILLAPMCRISDDMKPNAAVISILTALSHCFPTWAAVPSQDVIDSAFKLPEKRELMRNNPFSIGNMKPRLQSALELLHTTIHLSTTMHEVTAPLLILHGAADTVTDPVSSQQLHDEAQSKDKTLHLYPGMWHALLNGEPEEDSMRVWNDLITWVQERV